MFQKYLFYHTFFLMSYFVSLCNAFSVSDLLCGLLFVRKIYIYVISTVECILYHDAYWSLNSLSENSSCIVISFFLKEKENQKQTVNYYERIWGLWILFCFVFVFYMYMEVWEKGIQSCMFLNCSWLFDIIFRHRTVHTVIMEGFDFTIAWFGLLSGLSGLPDGTCFVFTL